MLPPLHQQHGMDPWYRCVLYGAPWPEPPPPEDERQVRRRMQNREAQRRLRERVRIRELHAKAAAAIISTDKALGEVTEADFSG